jgi:hypothetical protein
VQLVGYWIFRIAVVAEFIGHGAVARRYPHLVADGRQYRVRACGTMHKITESDEVRWTIAGISQRNRLMWDSRRQAMRR